MLCTNVWVSMPTTVRLHFAVERMQRGVKDGVWDVHGNTLIASNTSSVLEIIATVTDIRCELVYWCCLTTSKDKN
jgi:hypothetical protein